VIRERIARQHQAHRGIARGFQPFREVLAVKIVIWGVTFEPPQVGHSTFEVARSVTVSTTSKPFLQLSHMNAYVGIGFLPARLPASLYRAKRVWI